MQPPPQRTLLRIIDANLNRASEALRVAEDVCRFHWGLRGFSEELKRLRHAVLAAGCPDAAERARLLEARDASGDVGREIASPTEAVSAETLAFRNIERAKEALRALEEALRIVRKEAASAIESARYRLYEVEKGLSVFQRGGALKNRLERVHICLLATTAMARQPLEAVVRDAVAAGVGMVQLREKESGDRRLLDLARSLRELTASAGALLIVNDRPDIASLAAADGVHVGQEDLSVAEARRIVGPEALVGVSTHSVEQALAAQRDGADYVGAGPVFATTTKDAGPLLGLEGLRRVMDTIDVPVFAIGGITAANAAQVRATGAARVAVASTVLGAAHPAEQVESIAAALRP